MNSLYVRTHNYRAPSRLTVPAFIALIFSRTLDCSSYAVFQATYTTTISRFFGFEEKEPELVTKFRDPTKTTEKNGQVKKKNRRKNNKRANQKKELEKVLQEKSPESGENLRSLFRTIFTKSLKKLSDLGTFLSFAIRHIFNVTVMKLSGWCVLLNIPSPAPLYLP